VLWGVGGLTFGLSMRYLGVALANQLRLIMRRNRHPGSSCYSGQNLFAERSGILILIGVAISLAGIAIIGYAASLKSKNMSEEDRKTAVKEFALKKGILIAILAGVMSACFNFGLTAGQPIKDAALNMAPILYLQRIR